MADPDDISHRLNDIFQGRISVSPRSAGLALDYGPTKIAELVKTGELDSYLDGTRRKITVPSIYRYVKRKMEQPRTQRAVPIRTKKHASTLPTSGP